MVFKMIKFEFNSDDLEKKFAAIAKDADNIAKEVVEQVGSLVKTNARHYVPVDTGALKGSIDLVVNGNEAIIGSPLDYAAHVEYGTVNQAAQPYLTPALNDADAKTEGIVKRVVAKHVK